MPNRIYALREVAIYSQFDGEWAYYCGAQVTSYDVIPEGLTPISVPAGSQRVIEWCME